MQYQHGGSRSRMPPFARGGGGAAYSRGQKQFYPSPPPPPPLPAAGLPPPPLNKYEVLMEAGRLAAEYLVAKGVLPPASLQQRGGGVVAGGWAQLPPPPPLPAAQEAPTYYDARNGRRWVDGEYNTLNARSRRNRGGDYNNSNNSHYNARAKRKFGADNGNRYSDWGRDRGRSRGYSNSRSYDEEDEDGAPGFRKERRGSGVIDEVGSSVSGVAGEGPSSKVEVMGESDLEDTGSKVSSNNNARHSADAPQEVEDENEANKMQEDSVVSNSEVVEQALNGEGNSNNDSSGVVQEADTKHLPVSSDEKVSDGRPDDSGVLAENVEDDKALNEKVQDDTSSDEVSIMENNFPNDSRNLLNYCSFARIPTRPRSVLANRNVGPAQREIVVAEQVDLVTSEEMPEMAIVREANASSLASIQADNKDDLVVQEHADPSTTYNQVTESVTFHEMETQGEPEEMEEQKSAPQHCGAEDNKEHDGLSPSFAACQNNLNFQAGKGIQIYNLDTPPQDEALIDPSDKGKTVNSELLPNIGAEAAVIKEEENLGQSSSFKIRDLNLVGSPEFVEMRTVPRSGQCSTAECSMELQDKQQVDFRTTVGHNPSNTDTYAPYVSGNKTVQVIDIEDDSPIEAGACDTLKAKSEMVYSSMENMMNPPANTEILHGIQDGYSLAISDYLGADMPCYQSIQTDLQAGMGLNSSEGITVMDDPIYSSLSDIGFMEVWDQPSQDYEKFF